MGQLRAVDEHSFLQRQEHNKNSDGHINVAQNIVLLDLYFPSSDMLGMHCSELKPF